MSNDILDLRPATYGQAVLQMKRGAAARFDELRNTIDAVGSRTVTIL
ncbi:MAG: hypothetical protein GYA21_00015 [Myxococcales bacterium]|nr:hypothetical protein [Myxococcales bacterium]